MRDPFAVYARVRVGNRETVRSYLCTDACSVAVCNALRYEYHCLSQIGGKGLPAWCSNRVDQHLGVHAHNSHVAIFLAVIKKGLHMQAFFIDFPMENGIM